MNKDLKKHIENEVKSINMNVSNCNIYSNENDNTINYNLNTNSNNGTVIGDWGLSPIPNPH